MRILIAILMLCGSVVFGATNYFTDVTVEGTAYLTTNVFMEIDMSIRARADNSPYSGTVLYGNETAYVYYLPWGYAELLEPFEGMIANENRASSGVPTRFRFIVEARSWVSRSCGKWVSDIPVGLTNSADIAHTSIADFFIAAGLSSNGWRTAYSYDPSINNWRNFTDPMYGTNNTYSSELKTGEIFGPWIIDDLQLALDAMQYSWRTAPNSVDGAKRMVANSPGSDTNWIAAKAEAEADPYVSDAYIEYPKMYSSGRIVPFSSPPRYVTDYFTTEMFTKTRARESGSALHMYGGFRYTYAKTAIPDVHDVSTFDSNGYAWAVEGTYALVDSATITKATTAEFVGIKMASTNFPVWCDVPDPSSTDRGFKVVDMLEFTTANWPYTRE